MYTEHFKTIQQLSRHSKNTLRQELWVLGHSHLQARHSLKHSKTLLDHTIRPLLDHTKDHSNNTSNPSLANSEEISLLLTNHLCWSCLERWRAPGGLFLPGLWKLFLPSLWKVEKLISFSCHYNHLQIERILNIIQLYFLGFRVAEALNNDNWPAISLKVGSGLSACHVQSSIRDMGFAK